MDKWAESSRGVRLPEQDSGQMPCWRPARKVVRDKGDFLRQDAVLLGGVTQIACTDSVVDATAETSHS